MDEIVNLVAQKTGISKDQAKTAVDTVIGWLKQKLPPQIGGQLDAVMSGKSPQNIAGDLGGLLGKK